jgi:hypothetical protein
LKVRETGSININDPVLVIGHPSGLPTKVAGNAYVRDNSNPYFFTANTDTYGGNSGSSVFNANTGLIEGVLVRGDNDYITQGSCNVSYRCTDSGCMGEAVTRVSEAVPYIKGTAPSPVPAPSITPTSSPMETATPVGSPTPTPAPENMIDQTFMTILNLGIPDGDPQGISTPLNVSNEPAAGRKIIVSIDIRHTWIADLSVKVTAPNGNEISLHQRTGGSSDNIVKEFDVTGLSTGKAAGVWTLTVVDSVKYDSGSVRGWAIIFRK